MINEEYDISEMKEKIEGFPDQIMTSWEKGQSLRKEREPANLVVTGMGGSAIAGDLLNDLLFQDIEIPIIVNRGYELPLFVDEQTLLLVSSYSGNTEETIQSFKDGLKRKAMIVVFTSNGEIERIAENERLQVIKLPEGYPPRSALGFSFFSMLGLIKKFFEISMKNKDIENLILNLTKLRNKLARSPNEITELAEKVEEHIPLIHITRRLKSVALRWQTQLNENSKTAAHINVVPEANHNEIVGLEFPREMIKKMQLIFLRTENYENEQVAKRFPIAEDILRGSVGGITTIKAEGDNKLEDMFSLIYKGDFLSFYLSSLLGVDPTPVKRIDLLKKRLKN